MDHWPILLDCVCNTYGEVILQYDRTLVDIKRLILLEMVRFCQYDASNDELDII